MAARSQALNVTRRGRLPRRRQPGHVAPQAGCLGALRLASSHTACSGHDTGRRLTARALIPVARAIVLAVVLALTGASTSLAQAPQRIVSLVPALTEVLFAIGVGPQVVAVSSYDEWPAEVLDLPRVGALLDPDTERILSLDPDLVITYGSQGEVEAQFARAGISVFSYRHAGLDGVFRAMRELGAATGHDAEAAAAIRAIEQRLDAVRQAVAGRARPRTLLIFERQPLELRQVYASGGVGFMHDILAVAGGDNVFADITTEATQPSVETILVRRPDVVLEVRPDETLDTDHLRGERAVWDALGSIPAVRNDRVHFLYGPYLVVPGPRVADVAEAFARVLHPDAF
jgi:iron complex transport system substrate-binding protein